MGPALYVVLRFIRDGLSVREACPNMHGMRELKRSALVHREPAELFRLVNDIEAYPAFVPGCDEAVVLSRSATEVVARIGVRRGLMRTQLTIRNALEPPRRMLMQMVEGPFRTLEAEWGFEPAGEGACRVGLDLRIEFSSCLRASLFRSVVEQTFTNLMEAFIERAGMTHA
jgi:ribosome-associated toxin RatA of RatAB toxin-antitoxin module